MTPYNIEVDFLSPKTQLFQLLRERKRNEEWCAMIRSFHRSTFARVGV